jgi:hypothetical protein
MLRFADVKGGGIKLTEGQMARARQCYTAWNPGGRGGSLVTYTASVPR